MKIQWFSVLIGLSLDIAVLALAWHLLEPHVAFRNRVGSATALQQVSGPRVISRAPSTV